MERDILLRGYLASVGNFNSHAHVERDCLDVLILSDIFISTHTLTWSVTYLRLPQIFQNGISTHTLTWSVTLVR